MLKLVDLVEMVLISKVATPLTPTQTGLPIHIVASWLRSFGDSSEQGFDYQFALAFPNGSEFVVGSGRFVFGERMLYRITCIGNLRFIGGPGVARVCCRVRPAESEEKWIEQWYPIVVQ